jgi:hypothetical protein
MYKTEVQNKYQEVQMEGKSIKRQFRFAEKEFNKIQLLADMYAGGNVSEWIRYAALNAPRKILKKKGS